MRYMCCAAWGLRLLRARAANGAKEYLCSYLNERAIMGTWLNMTLDEETAARLDHLAGVTGRSKFSHAAEFIQNGLDEMEDWYLTQHRVDEFRPSDDAAIPLGQVDWS